MKNLFTRSRLYCPGPTPVGAEATAALLNTNVYHRTEDFNGVIQRCRRGLQPFFGTRQLPVILTASGTGAMEAAVSNLTNTGDQVLCVVAGKFGERWQKMTEAFGCQVDVVNAAPGHAPSPSDIAAILRKKKYHALFMQANETSTGVFLPVREICAEIRQTGFAGLIVVDAISALAAHRIDMDEWGIDALLSGSQKGFGVPPGLAFIAVSDRAKNSFSKRSRFYFDLPREMKNQDEGQTAWTPATGLLLALDAALAKMLAFGPESVFTHHATLAHATRVSMQALGLELFAPQNPSNALTSVKVPSGIDGKKLISQMREADGVIFAGGQDQLKGKIIRMSHLGFVDRLDVVSGIASLEWGLDRAGHKFEMGSGVKACLAALR